MLNDMLRDWWLAHRLEVYAELALVGFLLTAFLVYALVTGRKAR